MSSVKKIQLAGGPDKTATWIWLDPTDGLLKVEYYDFSEPVQTFFGNDISWTITVQEMDKLLTTINQNEVTLLHWMEQYFKSYFEIKQWLEENKIGFSMERESWA